MITGSEGSAAALHHRAQRALECWQRSEWPARAPTASSLPGGSAQRKAGESAASRGGCVRQLAAVSAASAASVEANMLAHAVHQPVGDGGGCCCVAPHLPAALHALLAGERCRPVVWPSVGVAAELPVVLHHGSAAACRQRQACRGAPAALAAGSAGLPAAAVMRCTGAGGSSSCQVRAVCWHSSRGCILAWSALVHT